MHYLATLPHPWSQEAWSQACDPKHSAIETFQWPEQSGPFVIADDHETWQQICQRLNCQTQPPHQMQAWLFTGQGSQFAGMGSALYDQHPVYRNIIDTCQALMKPHGEDLMAALYPEEGQEDMINATQHTQPCLFATELALAHTWAHHGAQANYLVGHSIGEIAAATFAGVMTLEEACALVCARARLMNACPRVGGMLAVMSDANTVSTAIESAQSNEEILEISAKNSPQQTVVSGHETALERLASRLKDQNIRSKKLVVSHAFHSALMAPMLEDFHRIASTIDYQAPQLPIIANVNGQCVESQGTFNADYWCQHIRQAVQFEPSMQYLIAQGVNLFVEMGPQPILTRLGQACHNHADDAHWLSSFGRRGDANLTLAQAISDYTMIPYA